MTDTQDERHGLPSASKMHRIANCPPSHQMEMLCPKDTGSEEAASGTRIHAVLAGLAGEDTLDAGEKETASMCQRQATDLLEDWPHSNALQSWCEVRLWLHANGSVSERYKPGAQFSGQFDRVYYDHASRWALLIDYKSGRGEYAEAVDNEQMVSNAALVRRWLDATAIRVAVVQPWVGKPTVADFCGSDALDAADAWLLRNLERERQSTPDQANPGPWCKYCRAAETLRCERYRTAQETAIAPLATADLATMSPADQRQALFERALELPASTLADIIGKLAMLGRMIDAAKAAGKERAQSDPEFAQFYGIKEKAGIRRIRDVGAAFEAASGVGVTAADFTARCKLGLGDMRELLHAATGSKGRELESLLESVLAGNIEQGDATVELKPVK